MKRRNFFGMSVGMVFGLFGVKSTKAMSSVDEADSFKKRWKALRESSGCELWYLAGIQREDNKCLYTDCSRALCFDGGVASWKLPKDYGKRVDGKRVKGIPLTFDENEFLLDLFEQNKRGPSRLLYRPRVIKHSK